MGDNSVEKLGLLFEKLKIRRGHYLSIVTVGDAGCGKKELIKKCFDPLPDVNVFSEHDNHEQYYFRLDFEEKVKFRFLIFDAKNTNFVKEGNFVQKTVFLHCYDVDNPESFKNLKENWTPIIFERGASNLHHFPVGIEREDHPRGDQEAPSKKAKISETAREEGRQHLLDQAQQLSREHHARMPLQCSLSDKNGLLKIFQTAVDAVYPRHSSN